jgi:hypothetical protein
MYIRHLHFYYDLLYFSLPNLIEKPKSDMRRRALQCPFCDNFLSGPVDLNIGTLELTGGICRCRAVYVLDRTGHNLGEIFLDGLTFACRGDIDKALSLNPEDYETEEYDYDLHSHTIGSNPRTGRASKLLFVKLKEE